MGIGCGPVAGEEVGTVLLPELIFRHPAEHILQPRPLVDPTCLAGGQQGVGHRCPLGRVVVPAEEVVLPPYGERPDAVLHHVVVYPVAAVGDVERELLEYPVGV